ncbi:SRPBCC domain-containing protein [Nonomuraea sp. NPDC050643]|uniref:SRPBCC domain-containing protein n=1 Tax=Nonomuraea sp. NPDC050643 TaxID=3155660 RepID=UPI0033C2E276
MSDWLARNHREIGRRDGARSVVLRRGYDAPIEDVWEACTEPDRLSRWLLKVSGDLRPGGTFALEATPGARSSAASAPTCSRSPGATATCPTARWSYACRPARTRAPRWSWSTSCCRTTAWSAWASAGSCPCPSPCPSTCAANCPRRRSANGTSRARSSSAWPVSPPGRGCRWLRPKGCRCRRCHRTGPDR